MTSENENFLTMARSVANLVKNNENEWNAVPKFKTYVNELYELLGMTKKHQKNAEIVTEGVTIDKATAGERAIKIPH